MRHLRANSYSMIAGSLLLIFISACFFVSALNWDVLKRLRVDEEYKLAIVHSIVSDCKNNFNWRDCYGKQIARVNYRLKFTDSLDILNEIQRQDDKTRDCHLISHRIASSEVEKKPGDWIKIFDYVDQTTCNNGFVHGVMEGRSRFESGLLLNEKTIPDICNQIQKRISRRLGETLNGADDACSHIIGHILLAQEGGVVDRAIDMCSKIPADIKAGCFDGVFMENITRENLEAHEIAKRFTITKDASILLEEVCKTYFGEVAMSCWRELAHIYTVLGKYEPSNVYDLCYQAENKQNANECFMHSINLMILSEGYSSKNLADTCRNYWSTEEGAESCITRSLFPLLGSSVDFIDKAVIFCDSQPTKYKAFCYTRIGEELKPKLTQDKRILLCQKMPKEFLQDCLGN